MTAPFVFSIQPAFVEAFRQGVKAFEYRTRRPHVEIGEMVLIYETAPRSMIVAEATVEEVVAGLPAAVWAATWSLGGIPRMVFDRYFAGHERAVAIRLAVRWLADPVPLPKGMAAPQSWARLKGPWPIARSV